MVMTTTEESPKQYTPNGGGGGGGWQRVRQGRNNLNPIMKDKVCVVGGRGGGGQREGSRERGEIRVG